jgi:putative peptidoglycan lipid II flippase
MHSLEGSNHLLWLGLGTTLGVAVQFLFLLPSLARADLWRLSFRFDRKDPALRAIGRLGSWTLLVVLTNQLSLYVILAFAFGLQAARGTVSAYTYGWSIMQMPYAVVVVSVLGVLTPQLAGLSTSQDYAGLGDRLRFGLRQSLVIIIPCTLVLVVFAQPIVAIALNTPTARSSSPWASCSRSWRLDYRDSPSFNSACAGLQSMQRAREVFFLYALENILTIALAIVLGRHSLAGLIASVSIAYSAAAVVALYALARHHVRVASVIWARARASQPVGVAVRDAGHGADLRVVDFHARARLVIAVPRRRRGRRHRLHYVVVLASAALSARYARSVRLE